jgi:hypothetical protein
MKRRDFLKSSVAAVSAAALAPLLSARAAGQPPAAAREFYELRLYRLRRGTMMKRFDGFYRNAAIPAMNRAGISTVGVFNVVVGPDSPTAYVLIPHQTAESVVTLGDRLLADADYLKAGADFLDATLTDPPYIRVESSLMVAFAGLPKLEVPAATAAKKSRLFELRTNENPSKKANKNKIEMFNQGEIAIFRRTGLTPVFGGETLIGPRLTGLTYMVVFEDMADREKKWAVFNADPEWQKLKSLPGFNDAENISSTSNVFLRPAAYSQI